MKRNFLLVLLLSTVLFCFAQKDSLHKKEPTIQPVTNTSNQNDETNLYKILYETAQKGNDNLRETTQWTIGIVVGFILLILGSQFLYNWRLNKQEITQIRSEMELRFQELQNSLSTERDDMFNSLRDDISNARKENQEYLRERFERFRETTDKLSDIYKKDIEKEILKLKTEIQELDADVWLLKGVEANALAGFIKTAQYKLELGQELKYTFSDIIPVLGKMEEIHDSDYNSLDKLISDTKVKFPAKYDEQLTKIEQNYKNKQTYIYQESRLSGELLSGSLGLFSSKKIVRPKKQ